MLRASSEGEKSSPDVKSLAQDSLVEAIRAMQESIRSFKRSFSMRRSWIFIRRSWRVASSDEMLEGSTSIRIAAMTCFPISLPTALAMRWMSRLVSLTTGKCSPFRFEVVFISNTFLMLIISRQRTFVCHVKRGVNNQNLTKGKKSETDQMNVHSKGLAPCAVVCCSKRQSITLFLTSVIRSG